MLGRYTGLQKNFYGYRGTDSMPDCTALFCWFVIPDVFYVHQSTFDALKAATPGVAFNNRIPVKLGTPYGPFVHHRGKYAPSDAYPQAEQTDL